MRVVMVSDVYFPRVNGVSTAIQTYHQALRLHGVDVRLVAPDYARPCADDEDGWITRVSGRPVPGDPEDLILSITPAPTAEELDADLAGAGTESAEAPAEEAAE